MIYRACVLSPIFFSPTDIMLVRGDIMGWPPEHIRVSAYQPTIEYGLENMERK